MRIRSFSASGSARMPSQRRLSLTLLEGFSSDLARPGRLAEEETEGTSLPGSLSCLCSGLGP